MFGLSIVRTAELQALQNNVAVLESDVGKLQCKYNALADQVQRSDKATRTALGILDSAVHAKVKTCPVLEQTHKHETDPVGAWDSKQSVLEQRLAVTTKDLQDAERMINFHQGRNLNVYLTWCHERELLRRSVQQFKQDIYEHSTRKPVVVQNTTPSETAVFVQHKKYSTLGLLKGNHITILSKGNLLDVGDVILNATPAVVHKFWDIVPNVESVNVHV